LRLALKFTAAFVAVTCLILGLAGYSRIRREMRLFRSDIERDHRILAHNVALASRFVGSTVGSEAVLDFIGEVDQGFPHLRIRYVSGHERAQPDVAEPLLAAGTERPVSFRTSEADGDWIHTYLGLALAGDPGGLIEIKESLAEEEKYVRSTIVRILAWTGVVVLLCAATAMGLGMVLVARPIHLLVAKARRIAEGDLSGSLHLEQKDELGQLAREMNSMADRLAESEQRFLAERSARQDTVQQLRHADRLTTVGTLASALAHELGTPLSVVTARAKMIASMEVTGPAVLEGARTIVQQLERMTVIIRQLLGFSRRSTPRTEVVDLRNTVRQTCTLLKVVAQKQRVDLDLVLADEPTPVRVDPEQIQQAVSNLVLNGIQAMPNGGTLSVMVSRESPHGRRTGCVAVSDQGEGIPAEHLSKIFEPFYTTKAAQGGTGLGLSIAADIAEEHGGSVWVESAPGNGSTFRFFLPVEDA
jgi:signal transduction histidine kinase